MVVTPSGMEQVIGFLNSISFSFSEIGYASFFENVVSKKILEISSLIEKDQHMSHQSGDQSSPTQRHLCESFKIDVSNGEIIDRFTILSIKLERIKYPSKLSNIRKEYFALIEIIGYIKSNFSFHCKTVKHQKSLEEHKEYCKKDIDVDKKIWNMIKKI